MIDIISKRCFHENCDKKPSYNYILEKNPKYC